MDIGYLGQNCLSCAAGENYEAHFIINQPDDDLGARDPTPYYVNPEFLHRYLLRKPGKELVLPEHERRRDLAAYPNSVIVEFDHQADSIDYVLHFPSDTAQRNVHRQLLDKVLHGKFHQFQRPYAVLLWKMVVAMDMEWVYHRLPWDTAERKCPL
jgi:hypothetical protein